MSDIKKKIDPEVLMAILKITEPVAKGKILYALRKRKLPEDRIEIDIELISEDLNIDFTAIIKDIRDNYLKKKVTREWILDYPKSKLILNKKTRLYPKTIMLPKSVSQFLTLEDQ